MVSAAEQLRSGVESSERVYLDNNEPRTRAWRPSNVSVRPTMMNRRDNSPTHWEADIDWVWSTGDIE